MIKIHNLSKSYAKKKILKNIHLSVAKGSLVAIMGKSGAGKSTFLHLLAALDQPDQGEIHIHEQSIFQMKGNQLADFRNQHIGIVFQFHHLLSEFTVLENVCIPGSRKKYTAKTIKTRAQNLLTDLGLSKKMHEKPSILSGGEQQRVAIARALINEPSILLADEPSGSLDEENAHILHQLLMTFKKKNNQTSIIATHNPQLAKQADQVYTIKNGHIIQTF